MITIKLPYTSTDKFQERLKDLRRQYSIVVRSAYKKWLNDYSQTEILAYCKKLNNIDNLSCFIIICALLEGSQIAKRFKDNPNIIFGSKLNFSKYCKNKITKEEYKNKRLLPFSIQGDKLKKGNRHFNLNIIDENFIEFKLNRNEHFILHLPKLAKNYKKKLYWLEEQAKNSLIPYSVRLTDKFIYISFEDYKKESINTNINTRFLSLDMNPDNIGLSICEYTKDKNYKVIHTRMISIEKIFSKFIDANLTSTNSKSKYYQNKLKFETIQSSKFIVNLAKYYHCKFIFIESLKFKKTIKNKHNNVGNRKCKNLWKRTLFVNNLKKRCLQNNIKIYEINPAYSSFIGNLQHNYVDSINASLEIGRRSYECIILKNKNNFYPELILNPLKHQWKEMVSGCKSWQELFRKNQNSKVKYRVQLEDVKEHFKVVLSTFHKKSYIDLYEFI
jgi:hypothetical protein